MTTRVATRLRDLTSADAVRILEITRATGVFREEELVIADEVFRDAVAAPGPSGGTADENQSGVGGEQVIRPYYALGAELEGELVGFHRPRQRQEDRVLMQALHALLIDFGSTYTKLRAVDPRAYRNGIATSLVTEMERRLEGRARLVSLDTSGRPDYTPTRDFSTARGYSAVARVPDFYAEGDDQVIFTKHLGG